MLIGDSAYQCTHYMLTPFEKEISKVIAEFNKGHRKAQTKIEHTFGIIKSR